MGINPYLGCTGSWLEQKEIFKVPGRGYTKGSAAGRRFRFLTGGQWMGKNSHVRYNNRDWPNLKCSLAHCPLINNMLSCISRMMVGRKKSGEAILGRNESQLLAFSAMRLLPILTGFECL